MISLYEAVHALDHMNEEVTALQLCDKLTGDYQESRDKNQLAIQRAIEKGRIKINSDLTLSVEKPWENDIENLSGVFDPTIIGEVRDSVWYDGCEIVTEYSLEYAIDTFLRHPMSIDVLKSYGFVKDENNSNKMKINVDKDK